MSQEVMNIGLEVNKLATLWVSVSNGMDNSNKIEFDRFYNVLKTKETRGEVSKALWEASKNIKSDNQRRSFVSMYKMASAYCDINTVCNYSLIEWTTLKRVVSQYKYVTSKYKEEDVSSFTSRVSNVYSKDMGSFRYNNALMAMLDTLKEEYTIVSNVEYTKVENEVSKLSVEDKRKLIAKLLLEVGE